MQVISVFWIGTCERIVERAAFSNVPLDEVLLLLAESVDGLVGCFGERHVVLVFEER